MKKKGQIWIETVIYTLIAFVMIGAVLAIAKPKMQELQDKAIIEQSLEMLKTIDNTITSIRIPGNQRLVELGIKKGVLKINGEDDKIIFEIESEYQYSQPEKDIPDSTGRVIAHTKKIGKFNKVTFTIDYAEKYNITYQGKEELKSITKSSTSYKLLISNKGKDETGKIIIDMGIN